LRNQGLGSASFHRRHLSDGGVRARNTHVQRSRSITEQERQMLVTLCARMGEEKDAHLLTEILSELNTLLDKVAVDQEQ
jgi:hypothetical protein